MLGDKCAGQHNLKTVYFKETIVSCYFWGRSWAICPMCFFAALYLSQSGGSKIFNSGGGGDPHKLFLKVPLANKQLASSNFTYRTRKKAAGAKSGKL
jgi:hypothetical protein